MVFEGDNLGPYESGYMSGYKELRFAINDYQNDFEKDEYIRGWKLGAKHRLQEKYQSY